MLGIALIVVLVLLVCGTVPAWPHSRDWGPSPSAFLIVLLIIVILLAYTGRI